MEAGVDKKAEDAWDAENALQPIHQSKSEGAPIDLAFRNISYTVGKGTTQSITCFIERTAKCEATPRRDE